jgi:DNA-binding response OmpR family regulator
MKNYNTLPTSEPTSARALSETNPPHRILVVEDDGDLRRLNVEELIQSGYEVDAAEDGAAGWEALNANSYDLLITDNSMPKLTGVELVKKLRAAGMALPVIMATGTLPTHEFDRRPWLIPDATLLKPFTSADLLGTVKNVLQPSDRIPERIGSPPTGKASHQAADYGDNESWESRL